MIATQLKITKSSIKEQLLSIEKNDIIKLQLFDSDINITLLEPREDDRTINRVSRFLTQQNELKKSQFLSVANYIQDTTSCKEQLLLNYFGEDSTENCGICSFCISEKISKKQNSINLQEQILISLKEASLNSSELLNQLQCSSDELLDTLRALADSSLIELLPNNKYKIK